MWLIKWLIKIVFHLVTFGCFRCRAKLPIRCVTGEVCRNYSQYLSSNHWNNVKGDAYVRCRQKCCWCKKKVGIGRWVGHHLTYKRLGREKRGDVVIACMQCHSGRGSIHRKMHAGIDVPKFAKVSR